ncbi:MAG: hypothetical protein OXL97_11390 [Chloroflexota bacterium]|nr:hypothetical protein [Chloroflexota bacterium]MDE2883510.1 hypothetical protein [Chloroflexota bacterium]
MQLKTLALVLVLGFVLGACESGPAATPIATPEPPAIPTATPAPTAIATAIPAPTATPTATPEPAPIPTATPTPESGPCAPGGEVPTEAVFSAVKATLDLPDSFSTSTGIEHAPASHGGVEWWLSFEAVKKPLWADEADTPFEGFVRGYWTPGCEVYPVRRQGQWEWMRSARVNEARVFGNPYVIISPGTGPAPTPTSARCAPGGEVPAEAVLAEVKDHMYAPETFTTSTGIEHAPSSRRSVLWWIGFEGVLGNGIPFDGFARGTWLPECYVWWDMTTIELPEPEPLGSGDGPLTLLQYGERICNQYPEDPTWNEHMEYMRSLPALLDLVPPPEAGQYHEATVALTDAMVAYLNRYPLGGGPNPVEDPAFLELLEGLVQAEDALDPDTRAVLTWHGCIDA